MRDQPRRARTVSSVVIGVISGDDGLAFHNGGVFGMADEVLEEGAIVNHGAAKILGACLSFGLANGDFVSGRDSFG